MLKYLVVIGVIAFVYYFFIKKKSTIASNSESNSSKSQSNDMVECSKCGTYAQIDDSILSDGKYYCSQECSQESK